MTGVLRRDAVPIPVVLSLAVALAAPGLAEAQETAFDEETTVVAVEVPVRVLRDGRPVRGLTAENFVVIDEGDPREITSFEVLDLEEVATGEAARAPVEVQPAARRHFLLLFDLDFTDGPYPVRAHEAALHQLGRYLGKEERRAPEAGAVAGDTLGMTVGGWNTVQSDLSAAAQRERSLADQALDWAGGSGGRRGGVDETLQDMADFAEEDVRQRHAARASNLVASLRNLADQYRWVDGQKYLVLFSQGFDSEVYVEEGGSWLLKEIRGMLDAFRKTGWSIYSIEGVDLNTATARRQRETLFYLAKETGGTVVAGRNDLSVSMARVLMQTSVTYLLGFQAPDLPADGSFRRLRVELRGVPRGTRVSHRAGYFVPRPFSELGEAEKRAQAAQLILSERERDELGAAVFAGPMELEAGGGLVPVVVELGREILLTGPADREAGAEIHVYALDPQGKVAGVLAQRVVVDPEKLVEEGGTSDGLKFFGELDLPPGRYDLRALARSLRTGWVTLRRVPVEGPAFSYLARTAGDGRHPDRIVVALRPERVAPGDYLLELTLSDPEGERIGDLSAPLRVVP